MTVKYANGTVFDLAANTWMTVDYSSLDIGNSTVTVTVNTDSLGPYYNQTDNHNLNFEVQTLDSTNSVTQNHLINIKLQNGKFVMQIFMVTLHPVVDIICMLFDSMLLKISIF